MVTPEVGNEQLIVKPSLPLRAISGAAHCSFTALLTTAEVTIPSLTAMALMVTLLIFSVNGTVYFVLDVVGVLPSVV